MKIIKAEEAKDMYITASGVQTKASAMAAELQVGEVLLIPKSEWKRKKPPYAVINYLAKKTGRKFKKGQTPDRAAWAIKRLS